MLHDMTSPLRGDAASIKTQHVALCTGALCTVDTETANACNCSRFFTLLMLVLLQMFTFPDWKRHRSSFRYVHHLQTIFE